MLSVSIKSIKIKDEDSEKLLLKDINFELEQNKVNVILGKNGTGKSTLIKALSRLLDERFYTLSGTVLLDKEDMLLLSQQELLNIRKRKSVMFFRM